MIKQEVFKFSTDKCDEYTLKINSEVMAQLAICKDSLVLDMENTYNLMDSYMQHCNHLDLSDILCLLEHVSKDYNIYLVFNNNNNSNNSNLVNYLLNRNEIHLNNEEGSNNTCLEEGRAYIAILTSRCGVELISTNGVHAVSINRNRIGNLSISPIQIEGVNINPIVNNRESITNLIDMTIVNIIDQEHKYIFSTSDKLIMPELISYVNIKESLIGNQRILECYNVEDKLIYTFSATKNSEVQWVLNNIGDIHPNMVKMANRLINYFVMTYNFDNDYIADTEITELVDCIFYDNKEYTRTYLKDHSIDKTNFYVRFSVQGFNTENDGEVILDLKRGIVTNYDNEYCYKVGKELIEKLSITGQCNLVEF